MNDESYELEVESVTQTERTYLDASGNENERTVHKVVARNEDGQKFTFQAPLAFPWRIGDPLTIEVSSTQAHLDEYEANPE